MKSIHMKTLALAICMTTSVGVFAQKQQQENVQNDKDKMARLDVNKDNLISKSEIKGTKMEKKLLANWTVIDVNNDGLLSYAEMKAFKKANRKNKS